MRVQCLSQKHNIVTLDRADPDCLGYGAVGWGVSTHIHTITEIRHALLLVDACHLLECRHTDYVTAWCDWCA